jgi:hypothetical protein
MKQEELLKWVECNLVKPFEGTMISDNKELVVFHEKITRHNREMFNALTRLLREEEKE